MAVNFPIDKAYLVAGWLESFFWGMFTVFFGFTIYGIYQKGLSRANRFTTPAIIILYVLATTHVSLALTRLIAGFITYRDVIDPVDYFANIAQNINVAKDYFYITNLVVGDSIVVWRLYVVWGNDVRVAAFPMVMILGTAIAGFGSISQFLLPNTNFTESVNWGTAMYVMSLSTNVIVTAVTAGRIWYVTHRNRKLMGNMATTYTRLILLLIESGFVIAAAKVTEFVLFEVAGSGIGGNNAMYIPFDIMPQITGLMPTLIVLAVNSGITQKDEYYSKPHSVNTHIQPLQFAPHQQSVTGISSDGYEVETTANSGQELKFGAP